MDSAPEYYRPASLEAALALLSRSASRVRPLAGGTALSHSTEGAEALVDLGDLGLAGISTEEGQCHIGAMTSLAELVLSPFMPVALRRAAMREAPYNLRARATLGGTVGLGQSSALLACLLVLNAQVHLEPGACVCTLEEYLGRRDADDRPAMLIVSLDFDLVRQVAYAEIARTSSDAPIVFVAVVAGVRDETFKQVRVATGGAGQPLALAPGAARHLEGIALDDLNRAAAKAAEDFDVAWVDDMRSHAEYRHAMVPILLRRALTDLAMGEMPRAD